MLRLKLSKRKPVIHSDHHGIEITIPANRKYFLDLFLAFSVLGWGFGEILLYGLLSNSTGVNKILLLVALLLWTFAGAFVIITWLWNFKREEIVKIDGQKLHSTRNFFFYKRLKEYDIANIKKLKVTTRNLSPFDLTHFLEYWGFTGGSIAFDYGGNVEKFAANLDETDAKEVVEAINDRFKTL